MNFTYAMLYSHLNKWFMSRGGDLLADPETKMDYINLAIQDIYNKDGATFLYVTEVLTPTDDGVNSKYITQFEINKVQQAFHINHDGQLGGEIKPTLFHLKGDCEMQFNGKQILMKSGNGKIVVTYVKSYEWAKYPEDLTKVLPLPKSYIPTILKLSYDWAAPINLMKSESAANDFYGHGMTRLEELIRSDGLTDYLDVNPQY